MTQHILQPYRKLEPQHISQLAYNGSLYWVSQSYRRGQLELDHPKQRFYFQLIKTGWKQINILISSKKIDWQQE